jgi:hypothetical protein
MALARLVDEYFYPCNQVIGIEGLAEIVVRAGNPRNFFICIASPAGQHQHGGPGDEYGRPDFAQCNDTRHVVHRTIEDHSVGPLELDDLPDALAIAKASDDMPARFKRRAHDMDDQLVIVGDDD